MLPDELKHLKLILASTLLRDPWAAPDLPGVYLFFLSGGLRLLHSTSYFEFGGKRPLTARGRQHLYTGAAAFTLRERLQANLRADITSSSFCRSLLAIEHVRKAISQSGTRECWVAGERSLTKWLSENALVGIEATDDPFGREHELLNRYASPFNIALRRDQPYSRALSAWRSAAFPADRPQRARCVRYI